MDTLFAVTAATSTAVKHLATNRVRGVLIAASLGACGFLSAATPMAQEPKFTVTPVAEKKVAQLPPGPLYWQIETFPTSRQARDAENAMSVVVEADGKGWLFVLGPKGASMPAGGSQVAEIGPVPPVHASAYLLRITRSGGPPGARTPAHSHPGPEAFYVLSGRMSQTTPDGTNSVDAGQSMNGRPADVPMVVSSVGTTDLDQFVMFVVDADRPFSVPANVK